MRLPEPEIQPTPLAAMTAFGSDLYAKLEYVHPTRSAKFRALAPHLYKLERSGELEGMKKVVIRSAGCAAVTTAWVCRRLGIPAEAVLPKHVEQNVADMLTRLGATVTRLEPAQATARIREMEADPKVHVVEQFNDERLVHYYRPVADEILSELPDVSAIVVGIGTAACIMGVAHEIRARQSDCRIIGVWPAEFDPTWETPYRSHGIAGLAPPVRDSHLERSWVDDILMIPSSDAQERTRQIFKRAGLPAGTSSGATLEAAIRWRNSGVAGPIVSIFASTFDCHLVEDI